MQTNVLEYLRTTLYDIEDLLLYLATLLLILGLDTSGHMSF